MYNCIMQNNRFIYFDVGGTLLDWSNVFKTAASKFNITPEDIGKIFDENHDPITKGLLTTKKFWEKCIQKYNLKNADTFNFLESWVSDYQPIVEMHELINKIKSRYSIGLLSNIYEGMLPLLLKKKIIPNIHYDQIVFSCDVGMMKPNPDIYALAQKRAQFDPKDILLVDDREDFLEGAKRAQWNTFLFDNTQPSKSAKKLEEFLLR